MQIGHSNRGFTLIELMAVLTIIAILGLMALPSVDYKIARAQIIESAGLVKPLKDRVTMLYSATHMFPKDNQDAGLPKPTQLLGNYVQRIDLINGAFHISFGNKACAALQNKILSIRPMVVKGSPDSPISWVCGNAAVPEGMEAIGDNLTNVNDAYAPLTCF